MNRRARYFLLLIIAIAAIDVGAWGFVHFRAPKRPALLRSDVSMQPLPPSPDPDLWARSMEKIKEDRGDNGNVALEIPPELRHYEDRHWFLATQVAEVKKFHVQPIQDYVDLAAMIERGEVVPVPAVTDTYILFGVGARVDGGVFTRYVANQNIDLNDEAGLRTAYARLESAHANLQAEISGLQKQVTALKKGDSTKQDELQKEIIARQQELKSNDENKAQLDQYYGQYYRQSSVSPESRPKLLRDYDSLQALAKDFRGRSFNLDDSSDRQALKIYLLSSLRPEGLKILEDVARRYHDRFDRPLPVSSLVRPEQYQHILRRFNRYAVLIDTPPHSTGLAFDIDYRYMNGAEQNFLMTELARMKDEGRIEVLRERGANYHVFAFIDGQRPSDELIAASIEEAGGPEQETNHADNESANAEPKSRARASQRLRR
jgi:Family of unknown function (DUF5715)